MSQQGNACQRRWPWFVAALGALSGCTSAVEPTSSSVGTSTAGTSTVGTGESDATSGGTTAVATTSASDTSSGADSTGAETGAMCSSAAPYTEVERCPEPVGDSFCSEGAMHVPQGTAIVWEHNPPHSGPHYPTTVNWDEHSEEIARGHWVHNLEHGGIVLLYKCPDGCDGELAILRQVMSDRPQLRIILAPDPEIAPSNDGPAFAAVSWTWVFEPQELALDELLCFVDQHEGNAPEDIP